MATATGIADADIITGQEAWRNYTHGLVTVVRLDHRGDLKKDEIIEPGRLTHISPLERRLNQEKYATAAMDPFLNGFLVPVRLLPDEPDTEKLLNNPNVISDEGVVDLVKQTPKQLQGRLAMITNPLTLERVKAAVVEHTDSIKRTQLVDDRIAEVNGRSAVEGDAAPPVNVDEGGREAAPGRGRRAQERRERTGRSM